MQAELQAARLAETAETRSGMQTHWSLLAVVEQGLEYWAEFLRLQILALLGAGLAAQAALHQPQVLVAAVVLAGTLVLVGLGEAVHLQRMAQPVLAAAEAEVHTVAHPMLRALAVGLDFLESDQTVPAVLVRGQTGSPELVGLAANLAHPPQDLH